MVSVHSGDLRHARRRGRLRLGRAVSGVDGRRRLDQVINGMINRATMFATLIMGLIAGPAVSLYGSPTVSPVTAAAWASDPLPPNAPSSISFLALSHAPPPDVIEIATNSPTTITPISRPPSASTLIIPTTNGIRIGISAGRII